MSDYDRRLTLLMDESELSDVSDRCSSAVLQRPASREYELQNHYASLRRAVRSSTRVSRLGERPVLDDLGSGHEAMDSLLRD